MKSVSKYLSKRKSAILKFVGRSKKKFEIETFHDLRLEIKKQNAFFDLVGRCNKNFNGKVQTQPLKRVYRQAGRVRDLQVEEIMLRNYFSRNELLSYKQRLHRQIETEKKIFFSMKVPALSHELKVLYKESKPFLSSVTKKAALHYVGNRERKIDALMAAGDLSTAKIHELRKRIKKLHFNAKLVRIKNNYRSSHPYHILPELLGKWHDRHFVIAKLKKTLKTRGIRPQEKLHLKAVIYNLSHEWKNLTFEIARVMPNSNFAVTGNLIKKT